MPPPDHRHGRVDYNWAANATGSIEWALTGFVLLLSLALAIAAAVAGSYAWRGFYNRERFSGLTAASWIAYFVAGAWILVLVRLRRPAPHLMRAVSLRLRLAPYAIGDPSRGERALTRPGAAPVTRFSLFEKRDHVVALVDGAGGGGAASVMLAVQAVYPVYSHLQVG